MTEKRRDWKRILRNGLILLAVLPIMGAAAYFSDFFVHASDFNNHFRTGDPVEAEAELEEMRSYYDQATSIPLVGWVADRWIFGDMPIYEARYFYMIGDYENVYETLDGVEDWRAYHILGSARFRTAQSLFRASQEANQSAIEAMVEESKQFYGTAVRNSPDSNFNDVWNYDLIYNPQARQQAFKSKGKKKKVRLGYSPGEGEKPAPKGQKDAKGQKSLYPNKGDKAGEGGDGPRKP